jgi:hypothetical protein
MRAGSDLRFCWSDWRDFETRDPLPSWNAFTDRWNASIERLDSGSSVVVVPWPRRNCFRPCCCQWVRWDLRRGPAGDLAWRPYR